MRADSRRILWAAGGIGAALAIREMVRRSREANIRGEVALITGSSRGLGFLLARELAREGCRLVICARDEGELDRAATDLRLRGAEVLPVPCDVTRREEVARLVERARERFGQIDILVNNAGTIQVGPVENMTIADFEEAMNVMFWGVLYPTIEILPGMYESGGRIVNITSIGGKVSVPHLIPYNCAKFAAVALSEGLRAELAKNRIHVLTVVPGLMRTGSYLNAFFKGQQENEFRWFGPSASIPLISMDATRAARQIVRAMKRSEAEKILSFPAALLARFHGLFPGLTTEILSLVARLLPSPSDKVTDKERGMDLNRRINSKVFDAATILGRSAAGQLNQYSAG